MCRYYLDGIQFQKSDNSDEPILKIGKNFFFKPFHKD